MAAISKPTTRVIIDDFARDIRERMGRTVKPSTTVVNFRTDRKDNKEREVVRVPIDLLRFRKDNGRISSDVADHERNLGPLDDKDDAAQQVIARFLDEKDPEQTHALRQSILHIGQDKPAIITSDGFLIDGNRRKLVMEKLHKEFPQDESFGWMKVVILPGKNDEGGPPTLVEIEKLENRYQLQSDGKSEYYGFDRALSIKRKMAMGLSLIEQLRDDPRHAGASDADIDKAVKEVQKKYLNPLDCADRYLKQFQRKGQYRTISKGMSDPEGRWQALVDYSDVFSATFSNQKRLVELGIQDGEIGAIEEAAFDIIRLRHVPEQPKVHYIMRELPKLCSTADGKKEILMISQEVEPVLQPSDCRDKDGNYLSIEDVDAKWAGKNKQTITYRLNKASKSYDTQKERDTPLDLLDAAYKKLTHQNMDPGMVTATELSKARQLAASIQVRAHELEQAFFELEKSRKKYLGKKDLDD